MSFSFLILKKFSRRRIGSELSIYLSRGFSLLTLGDEMVNDVKDGLLGQDVLLLLLHHPGVVGCPDES